MPQAIDTTADSFVDRRNTAYTLDPPAERDRRQFTDSREGLSPEGNELAAAIDEYKLSHRRRFITFDEMLFVMKSLGYQK